MVLTTPTNFDKEGDWGKAVRDITDKNTGDMQVYVTGNLGFSADAKEVFSNIDTKLLLATVVLVLVLLGAIYRSVTDRDHPADRRLLRLLGRPGR